MRVELRPQRFIDHNSRRFFFRANGANEGPTLETSAPYGGNSILISSFDKNSSFRVSISFIHNLLLKSQEVAKKSKLL